MSFQQGLSGLNSSAKALDAISNNIANGSTVGFKGSAVHFSDVYANSLSGSGASNIGIGSALSAVQQQFTQGNLTATNNPLDIAINGGGFFRMNQAGTITFSRNGQFHLDREGYVINDKGARLTGYEAQGGVIVKSEPKDIQIDASDIDPVQTGQNVTGAYQGLEVVMNLDSRSPPITVAFDQTNPNTYNFSTSTNIYDSLGNAHNFTMFFVKSAANTWSVEYRVDGSTAGGGSMPLNFSSTGALNLPTEQAITVDIDAAATALGKPTTGAIGSFSFGLQFAGTTQFGSSSAPNRMSQDGYASGRLTGMNTGADGVVLGRYSNGQSRNLAQVVLANFTNPNGLASIGGNQWADTSESGPPLIGTPNTGALGVLTSSAVEESNVDMTAELVAMITQQRSYQANAQSIKTQDSILQTLVNLR